VGAVYIGGPNVTTATGLKLDEDDVLVLTADMVGSHSEEFYLNEVFVISATGTNSVRVAAFRRRV